MKSFSEEQQTQEPLMACTSPSRSRSRAAGVVLAGEDRNRGSVEGIHEVGLVRGVLAGEGEEATKHGRFEVGSVTAIYLHYVNMHFW
jgi:hypothetical protein